MRKSVLVAGVLALALTIPVSAAGGQPRQDRSRPSSRASAPRFDRYQVPAGAALLLKLRTPLDSASASIDDQVEATLWSPVIQDGVELIPVGSVAIGKVVDVVRASERTPIGAVTFALAIVEHAETGSRATLSTRKVVIEAPRAPDARGRGKRRNKAVDVIMPAGTSFVAMTAEPLLVRIPR